MDQSVSSQLKQFGHGFQIPIGRGDIDILAGPLNWSEPGRFEASVFQERAEHPDWHVSWKYELAARRFAREGGIQWPPPTRYLVGVEAKCAYLPRTAKQISADSLKSTKAQLNQVRKTRRGVEKLLAIGLDHAVLLDIVANPPVSGPDGGAWLKSLALAHCSAEAMSSIFEQRLPDHTEAAHWVWSAGSVAGGDEFHRGAGTPIELRKSRGNSRLANSAATCTTRKDMEQRLRTIFSALARPTIFPSVFVDCPSCGRIHAASWEGTGCETA
jgi:hypothetical protein